LTKTLKVIQEKSVAKPHALPLPIWSQIKIKNSFLFLNLSKAGLFSFLPKRRFIAALSMTLLHPFRKIMTLVGLVVLIC